MFWDFPFPPKKLRFLLKINICFAVRNACWSANRRKRKKYVRQIQTSVKTLDSDYKMYIFRKIFSPFMINIFLLMGKVFWIIMTFWQTICFSINSARVAVFSQKPNNRDSWWNFQTILFGLHLCIKESHKFVQTLKMCLYS